MNRRRPPLARISRIVGGGLLIVLGVVGLVLPVMPGWLFLIPGLSLWAGEFVWAGRLRDGARDRLRRGLRPDSGRPGGRAPSA